MFVDAKDAPLRTALEEHPFLVKPNLEEAAATLDFSLGEVDAYTAVAALTKTGARWVLVSAGAIGSLLGDDSGGRWRIEPPRVEAVNPIGSGDALAAGLLLYFVRARPLLTPPSTAPPAPPPTLSPLPPVRSVPTTSLLCFPGYDRRGSLKDRGAEDSGLTGLVAVLANRS